MSIGWVGAQIVCMYTNEGERKLCTQKNSLFFCVCFFTSFVKQKVTRKNDGDEGERKKATKLSHDCIPYFRNKKPRKNIEKK